MRNILKRNELDPGPRRGEGTWDEFVKRHVSTLWACDIFSTPVWALWGRVDYFIAFFLEIGTRKIRFFNMTPHPTGGWMAQQARNLWMICEESDLGPGYLVHDRDTKFTAQFDGIVESSGCSVKRLPYKSPNLNQYAESWVGTIKRECLDHFIVLGEGHLGHLVREYVKYYNSVRPHGAIGGPLDELPVIAEGEVCCEEKLGGLLKHYYREAA